MDEWQHIVIVGDQLVRNPASTLMDAANEYAAATQGNVVFCCPNYAVVATHSRKEGNAVYPSKQTEEVTIWLK